MVLYVILLLGAPEPFYSSAAGGFVCLFVCLFVHGLRKLQKCHLTKGGTYTTLKAYLGYQVLLGNSLWR